VYATVPADLGTEESLAYTQQVQHDDGLVSDLTYVHVGRTGNALYLESSYGAAGGDQVVAEESARLIANAAAPLQEMCRFAEHPCAVEGQPAPPSGSTHDIPDDFPLALGITTDVDFEVTGPDPLMNGVSFDDLCGTGAWPGAGTTDRLAVRVTGPEYGLVRELQTFENPGQAAAVVDALRSALQSCPTSPAPDGDPVNDRLFQTLDADTGYPSSVTFGFTYRNGLGGALFQVVRVGRAVLATVETGEFGPDSLAIRTPGLTDDNRVLTDLMRCSWTTAGC
jgi:hypothetical protein